MKKIRLSTLSTGIALLFIQGCAQGDTIMTLDPTLRCGDKPNCVSTLDPRPAFHLAPFELAFDNVPMSRITEIALTLPGARLVEITSNVARIESVSKIMRFVDDVTLQIEGNNLVVRSVSRLGYSDFGVNRKRAEALRVKLQNEGLIK